MGVITNGQPDMQRATLRALGLEMYFPVVVVSAEVGAGKPRTEIFSEAIRRAGVAAGESAHVGDSLLLDVAGAKPAGLQSVLIDRTW